MKEKKHAEYHGCGRGPAGPSIFVGVDKMRQYASFNTSSGRNVKRRNKFNQDKNLTIRAQGVQIAANSNNDNTGTEQVGAFPFTATGLIAANTRVVDEATPSLSPVGPILEAIPLEESEQTETPVLSALLKSRKCRIILALTVMLVFGLIVAVVLVTHNSSKASQSSGTEAPALDKNNESSSASPQAPHAIPPGFETTSAPPRHHPYRLNQPKHLPTLINPAHSLPPILLQDQVFLPQKLL
jgi:hypothetical protein